MSGKLIVLEGIDGSGKTTIATKLTKDLMKINVPIFATREPSDGEIGKLIHKYLSGECVQPIPYALQLLFISDRLEHINDPINGILKSIESGVNVICDRFLLSTVAYTSYIYGADDDYYVLHQSVVRELDRNISLLKEYKLLMENMYTIYLDVEPEISVERTLTRNKQEGVSDSIFEGKLTQTSQLHLAYHIASALLKHEGYPVFSVDANRTEDAVYQDVFKTVTEILDKDA